MATTSAGLADSGRRALFLDNTTAFWWSETGRIPIELPQRRGARVRATCATLAPAAVMADATEGSGRLYIVNDAKVSVVDMDRPPVRVAISDDGRTVAAALVDAQGSCAIRAWDAATQAPIEVRGSAAVGETTGLAVSSGANLVALSSLTAVATWRRTGDAGAPHEQCRLSHGASVLAASSAHSWIAAVDGRVLRLCDLATGDSAALRGHRESMRSIAFSPDGSRVLTAGPDADVRLWQVQADTLSCGVVPLAGVSDSTLARRMLVYGSRSPATLSLVELATGKVRQVQRDVEGFRGAVLDRAGSRIAILTGQALSILDAESLASIQKWDVGKVGLEAASGGFASSCRMAFDPGEGQRILIAAPQGKESGQVFVLDLRTGDFRQFAEISQPYATVLSCSSSSVVVAGCGWRLLSWPDGLDAAPSSIVGVNAPSAIAVSRDQDRIGVATWGGFVYVAPLRGPELEPAVMGHAPPVRAIEWLEMPGEGRGRARLVFGSGSAGGGAASIWALDPLRSLCVEHLPTAVVGLAFDEPTETLWVATADGFVRALRTVASTPR